MKTGTLAHLVAVECLAAIQANWKQPPSPGTHRCREAMVPVTHQQLKLWGSRWRIDPKKKRKHAAARSSLARFVGRVTTALVEDANRMGWPHRFGQLPAWPELGSSIFVASDIDSGISVRARISYDGMLDRYRLVVDWMGDPSVEPTWRPAASPRRSSRSSPTSTSAHPSHLMLPCISHCAASTSIVGSGEQMAPAVWYSGGAIDSNSGTRTQNAIANLVAL